MDDIMLFMMVICHQPYSEIVAMPVETSVRLSNAFARWMDGLFGKTTPSYNPNEITPNLNLEEIIKNVGRHE